jgi:sugar lactone lactonase YvrE
VALDGAGNLYIADSDNNRIRKVDAKDIISTVAGNGTAGYGGDNGVPTGAALNSPAGLAVDMAGNLYIADSGNNRIRKVNVNGIIGKSAKSVASRILVNPLSGGNSV